MTHVISKKDSSFCKTNTIKEKYKRKIRMYRCRIVSWNYPQYLTCICIISKHIKCSPLIFHMVNQLCEQYDII